MKIEELRKRLAEKNLAGLLVTDKINRRYLCGFTGSNGLLLVTENNLRLFVDGRYTQQAQQQTTEVEICEIPVGGNLIEALRPFVKGLSLGFEAGTISYQAFTGFQALMIEVNGELVATKNLVEGLRIIKTAKEIAAIKQAAAIADQTLEMILPMIRVGMTELELANEIDYRSKKLGSEGPAFETIVASGERTALPHAHASQKKITANELIMIDFGAIYQGYYSDITRTFGFGEVGAEIKETYQKVLAAQKQAIQAVALGKTLGNIDQTARQALAQENLAQYFSHNLGHGIGLSCHEYPALAPTESLPIEKNMTFTIEPGVYLSDSEFGIRIEDDIVVNEAGHAELLTHFSKEWMTIDCNR
ncbi:aminopeptidase P family protein [Enterococcus sp.]|uniref:M24 family metallopeptidase n=1 Tax=Enterococcus sp. TaxID=35783 RepID=UPI00290B5D26|nr:aminopeptidase P family protein [Enterococcus sp.]MDU5336113.1 aminopeptidase P family protein [Enterococcus sp.]